MDEAAPGPTGAREPTEPLVEPSGLLNLEQCLIFAISALGAANRLPVPLPKAQT